MTAFPLQIRRPPGDGFRLPEIEGVALRATFLIDREGVIRHSIINDLSLGRSIDDTLRTLDALKHIDETGEVCPANWSRGKPAMEATPAGVKKYLREFKLGS